MESAANDLRTITNRFLTVRVKDHGAELCSIRSASGREYLWQGDPTIWGRHAPVLFPIVGKLADDRYSFEGKSYGLKQHGFARDMDFELVEETAKSLSFQLLPSPETRQRYPFEFALRVNYLLEGSSLEAQYEVRNRGNGVMPFSIGAHPGFALNWGADDRIEDYFLEFEKVETLDASLLGRDNLLSAKIERVMENENLLPLRKEMFNRDALIFLHLESERISLGSYKHKNRVTMEFPAFPNLGIWAKPGAPFICIEPWFGHADTEETDGILMNKPGIIKLKPGGSFTSVHRVTIEE